MFFCSLIKQPRGRKRRRLPREREEARRWRRGGKPTRGGRMGGRARAWRWSDYEERKGTAGGTTGKKRRRMRKAALLGERRGRAKMAERERVKLDTRMRDERSRPILISRE